MGAQSRCTRITTSPFVVASFTLYSGGAGRSLTGALPPQAAKAQKIERRRAQRWVISRPSSLGRCRYPRQAERKVDIRIPFRFSPILADRLFPRAAPQRQVRRAPAGAFAIASFSLRGGGRCESSPF